MANIIYRVGVALKESALALDRLGCRLQGNYAFREERELAGLPPCTSRVPADGLSNRSSAPQ